MSVKRIAIFASGNGSNAEEIIRHFQESSDVSISLVLSNNPEAYVLKRAEKYHIPTRVFDRQTFRETEQVLVWLTEVGITHIVLAGFLWLVPSYILEAYAGRIINIHPSLLPRHGGKGMYGMKVHEAVKAAGDSESGITIHLVDSNYDEGKVVFQITCPVLPSDSPKDIADKVHHLEYQHFPVIIEKWLFNHLSV